ncbi:MAG: hypothetical protein IPJ33_11035 [Gammaproteobacteria bacterium]|nr:hypothetical protein [Gammaproteobacteria bacterium]MBP6051002.1 hypothetical protein [Pseudomonadales bacterium]MBK6582509.1 hypothetical protein [Gammaproteobacteria bacterium]MBK7169654.1 hypothetical protein [Gammaproteobacteria bacterium]MBK7521223.1 hypothetical protein [Gammaproteobacteria bacterium]
MSLPEVKDTHYEDVEVGENIPSISIGPLSHTHFVFIASSHHDWYPGHHDVEYARKQGLPDIFMNATWQHALIQRLVCSWAGPNCIPRKIKYRMGMPIVRYETITVRGIITGKRVENGEHLADLDVWFDKEDGEGNVHEKITVGSAIVVLQSTG